MTSDEVRAAAARRLHPVVAPAPGALTSIPARRGARVVVVAGPGVLAARAARSLRTLAGITGATVVNTVGAKGLFAWDDPLHGGTVGLQVEDPTLAEVTTADLVVTTGLDPTESASLTAALAARVEDDPSSVVDVHPAHLALAAGGWPPADGPGARPPIYDRMASVVGPMYAAVSPDAPRGSSGHSDVGGDGGRSSARVPPPGAAKDLADQLPDGGLVVAAPGSTGFWIGRAFPTSVAGSVIVTTGDPDGTAESLAFMAARSGRPTTLVVADVDLLPAVADGSLARAVDSEALPMTIEIWGDGATASLGGAHRRIAVDWSAIDHLLAVAGAPDAAVWPGWVGAPTDA